MNNPIITVSENVRETILGIDYYTYYFDYNCDNNSSYNYMMIMSKEAFNKLCKNTGWELYLLEHY